MFDIGWSEMAVILLVALVVIGPRDLPRVARTMGKWVAKGRSMAREFQTALEDMAREAELDKVKSEIEKVGRTNLGKSIENTIDPSGELGKAFDPKAKSAPKAKSGSKKDKDPAAKPIAGPKEAAATDPAAAVEDRGTGPENGAGEAAAPVAAEPAPVPPAAPDPAGSEPEGAASRPRTKAPERETVPADPS